MTHPDIEQAVALRVLAILDVAEQRGVPVRADLRIPELAHLAGCNRAPELRRHRVHPVTDAQYRDTQRPHDVRRSRRLAFGNALGTARQNDPLRGERANFSDVDIEGLDLAIDMRLAQAARDQLRVLGAEIEDQDLRVRGCGHARV